jgi:imidazolonepropionase
MAIQTYENIGRLYTGQGIAKKKGRGITESDMGLIENASLVVKDDRVAWFGPREKLPKEFQNNLPTQNLEGRGIVTAGWIDCHTHLIFGGDRAEEFSMRAAGATYQQIAQKGGGILASVRATRDLSHEELLASAENRLKLCQSLGTAGIEIKSGYGLNIEAEIKSLEVIQSLKQKYPKTPIQSTFMGAHAIPAEYSFADDYIEMMRSEMLPEIRRCNLADTCDIFVDEGYFTTAQARVLLSEARELGFKIKVHADEMGWTGATELAVELGALSADHLLNISKAGVSKISKSETVAVLLPATAFYLKARFAPAKALIEAGACVAISTDFNPGSSPNPSLPFSMTLAALYLGMSAAEILAGVTYNAAKALGWEKEYGTIEIGRPACLTILPDQNRFESILYRSGFAW